MCMTCGCGKKPAKKAAKKAPAKKAASKPLVGKQNNLDVAAPKGKLTGADFKALRKKAK